MTAPAASRAGGRGDEAPGGGEYASGEATSHRIGEELGVSADVMRNWKHTMLTHDDKEPQMHDGHAGSETEPAGADEPASSSIEDMRRQHDTSSSCSWRPCGPNGTCGVMRGRRKGVSNAP